MSHIIWAILEIFREFPSFTETKSKVIWERLPASFTETKSIIVNSKLRKINMIRYSVFLSGLCFRKWRWLICPFLVFVSLIRQYGFRFDLQDWIHRPNCPGPWQVWKSRDFNPLNQFVFAPSWSSTVELDYQVLIKPVTQDGS